MLRSVRNFAAVFLKARMRRQVRRFLADVQDCRAVQQQVLRELLALNATSQFARAHRFDQVRTAADFRRQVPVADYEYYRPHIEQVKAGNVGALLGERNPPLMFSMTSGTTAESKYIPVTRRFLADYRRGWRVWGIRAYDAHPALFVQDMVQLGSDYDQFRTPAGVPCGNISGLVAKIQSPLVKLMYTVPYVVSRIKLPEAKYYAALRLSLANRHVGILMTANPSTLVQLARLADQRKEDLIRDIHNGTLCPDLEIAPEIRRSLLPATRRGSRLRARELEGAVQRRGALLPADCWPGLSLLAVWLGGSAGAYVPALRKYYGDVPVRDHGLSASEGRMTIPFADGKTEGLLDVRSHYFEFIPEEEFDSQQPTVLEAHELSEGRSYYILLSTASGLCRYNIRDVVRCTGFEGTTPLLEFLNKGAHIASVTGEKLSEWQVVHALRNALADAQHEISHYTLTPQWGDPPGYRLMLQQDEVVSPQTASEFARRADLELQALNMEYADRRRTGRLAAVAPVLVPAGSFGRFARHRQSKTGGSVEQYKHPCLVPDLKFLEGFLRDFAAPDRQSA
jgi:hypothetical protein